MTGAPARERERWGPPAALLQRPGAQGVGVGVPRAGARKRVMLGLGGLGSWAVVRARVLRVGGSDRGRRSVEEPQLTARSLRERDVGRRRRAPRRRWPSSARRSRPDRVATRRRPRRTCGRCPGQRLRGERRRPARARHRALGEPRVLRAGGALHHDEPLAAGRAGRPALCARARTGCFECQDRAYRASSPALRRAGGGRRGRRHPPPPWGRCARSSAGRWPWRRSTCSRGLSPPATLGTAFAYDLRTMEITREVVMRDPECPWCAPTARRTRPTCGPSRSARDLSSMCRVLLPTGGSDTRQIHVAVAPLACATKPRTSAAGSRVRLAERRLHRGHVLLGPGRERRSRSRAGTRASRPAGCRRSTGASPPMNVLPSRKKAR